MTYAVNAEMDITCKHFVTAMNRFFKKHPELDYWREQFEWMHENGIDFSSDNRMADGTKNPHWRWALHLDEFDTHYYICVLERD